MKLLLLLLIVIINIVLSYEFYDKEEESNDILPYLLTQHYMKDSLHNFQYKHQININNLFTNINQNKKKLLNNVGPSSPCPKAPPLQPLPTPFPPILQKGLNQLKLVFENMMKRSNVSGAVVSIIYDQQELMTYTYGSTRQPSSAGHEVNGDSQFAIGSISKVFTDMMAIKLHEEDKISLLDQITKWAPEYKPTVPYSAATRGGTLRDLGSHLAGLPRYSPCPWGNCTINLKEALERVSNWTLLWPSMTQLAYSNTGFSLLGRILERATDGESYETYVGKLLAKLNMTRTIFDPPKDQSNLCMAYDNGIEIPPQSLGFTTPAGGIISTGNDMAKLMKLLFRDRAPANDKEQILDGTTIREWVNTRLYSNPSSVGANQVFFTDWAFPWQIYRSIINTTKYGNLTRFFLTTKDGSVPGYNSQLLLQTDLKLGVFTSMATNGSRAVPFFSDAVVNTAFAVAPVLEYVLSTLPYTPPMPPNPEDYVGHYVGEGVYSMLSVNVAYTTGDYGKRLYVTSSEGIANFALKYQGEADMFLEMPALSDSCVSIEGGNHYNVKFHRDNNGKVIGFHLQGFLPFNLSFDKKT